MVEIVLSAAAGSLALTLFGMLRKGVKIEDFEWPYLVDLAGGALGAPAVIAQLGIELTADTPRYAVWAIGILVGMAGKATTREGVKWVQMIIDRLRGKSEE